MEAQTITTADDPRHSRADRLVALLEKVKRIDTLLAEVREDSARLDLHESTHQALNRARAVFSPIVPAIAGTADIAAADSNRTEAPATPLETVKHVAHVTGRLVNVGDRIRLFNSYGEPVEAAEVTAVLIQNAETKNSTVGYRPLYE